MVCQSKHYAFWGAHFNSVKKHVEKTIIVTRNIQQDMLYLYTIEVDQGSRHYCTVCPEMSFIGSPSLGFLADGLGRKMIRISCYRCTGA